MGHPSKGTRKFIPLRSLSWEFVETTMVAARCHQLCTAVTGVTCSARRNGGEGVVKFEGFYLEGHPKTKVGGWDHPPFIRHLGHL